MKKVIITGGSRGIGNEISNTLIRNKYFVINISKNKKNFKKNKFLKNYECDVSDHLQVENTFKKILRENGSIYALINNAGINPSRNIIGETSFNDFDKTLKTNVYGAFNCTKFFINKKNIKKSQVIINISSIVSMAAHEKRGSYSISKSALNGLTRSVVADYSKLNLRCFSICPGYIQTDLTKNFLKNLDKKSMSNLLKAHKLGRLGKSIDIANLVVFLLDEKKSSWMTGNIIPVDGGYLS
jgi:NAD(P)-dependent dehydrogenase (short-subunit alcohol dehydrogenase family)